MPANTPRERDQVRISACSCASVSADDVRPTGPAATDASAPKVNLLASSFFAPGSLFTSMTTSVSEPPIWNPTLPPSTRIAAGADQPTPPGLQHSMNPLPYLAPTMKAPFLRPGTSTTH